jgi:hypothetical protein
MASLIEKILYYMTTLHTVYKILFSGLNNSVWNGSTSLQNDWKGSSFVHMPNIKFSIGFFVRNLYILHL